MGTAILIVIVVAVVCGVIGYLSRGSEGAVKINDVVEDRVVNVPRESVKTRNSSGDVARPQPKEERQDILIVPKPYTIVSSPFLSDVLDIDYNKKLYFQYELNDSQTWIYPLMQTPQKGTVIKFPVQGRTGKRGISEQILCDAIRKYKLMGFFDNLSIVVKETVFTPDLVYINLGKGIFIDIEIDEPYAGFEKLPIHYKMGNGTVDDRRNLYFTERGWIVLRFSEKQIVEQRDSCLKYIYEVVRRMDTSMVIPEVLVKAPALKEMEMWTLDKAKEYIRDHYREKMLGISEFVDAPNVNRQTVLADYDGASEIEENIKRKKEDGVWKQSLKTGNVKNYVQLYPKGRYVDAAKENLDESLWEECKRNKEYSRYLNETNIGKFKAEAESLLAEQRRMEERERRVEEQRLKEIRDREERERLQRLAEQRRREEEERKKREARNYERRQVSTNTTSTKTSSSRGYA